MKTSELSGAVLDWAVAKCEGFTPFSDTVAWVIELDGLYVGLPKYSTDWREGGAIIEREKIRLDCAWNPGPWKGCCKIDGVTAWMEGDTPLIAAMRCYVASKLGDEVELPEELK